MGEITSRSISNTVSYLYETYDFDEGSGESEAETLSFAEDMYRKRVTVVPGMPSLFTTLRKHEVDIGVVSSALPHGWSRRLTSPNSVSPESLSVYVTSKGLINRIQQSTDGNGTVWDRSLCIHCRRRPIRGARAADSAEAAVIRY